MILTSKSTPKCVVEVDLAASVAQGCVESIGRLSSIGRMVCILSNEFKELMLGQLISIVLAHRDNVKDTVARRHPLLLETVLNMFC